MISESFFVVMLIPAIAVTGQGSDKDNGIKAASQAYYQHSGMATEVKRLEKKYINKDVRQVGAVVSWIINVEQSRMITYSWSF